MVKIGNIDLGEFPLLLAPMEDVSDPPFRSLCKENGADVVYTEFISSEGLIRDAAKSVIKLDIYEKERPVGIQIFGANLDSMLQAVDIVEKSNPDIIDINYGCPVKKVVSKGAGAGILKDICLMESLTKAIAINGRTRAQMYKGEADWSYIEKVKNNPRMHIPVFANGDINTPEKAMHIRDSLGLDGAMIGRASIGNPWFFNEVKHYFETGLHKQPASIKERAAVAKRHLEMSVAWKGERLGVYETRRHYSNYFKGIENFKPFRKKLVTTESSGEIYEILDSISEKFTEYSF